MRRHTHGHAELFDTSDARSRPAVAVVDPMPAHHVAWGLSVGASHLAQHRDGDAAHATHDSAVAAVSPCNFANRPAGTCEDQLGQRVARRGHGRDRDRGLRRRSGGIGRRTCAGVAFGRFGGALAGPLQALRLFPQGRLQQRRLLRVLPPLRARRPPGAPEDEAGSRRQGARPHSRARADGPCLVVVTKALQPEPALPARAFRRSLMHVDGESRPLAVCSGLLVDRGEKDM
mmetsp:Transcript_59133/g.171436  ORF Transcript_59133/g.171436 Transcript_59133/m.171436 type:complete len:231 (-) Transcript_59133:19-711(-)